MEKSGLFSSKHSTHHAIQCTVYFLQRPVHSACFSRFILSKNSHDRVSFSCEISSALKYLNNLGLAVLIALFSCIVTFSSTQEKRSYTKMNTLKILSDSKAYCFVFFFIEFNV